MPASRRAAVRSGFAPSMVKAVRQGLEARGEADVVARVDGECGAAVEGEGCAGGERHGVVEAQAEFGAGGGGGVALIGEREAAGSGLVVTGQVVGDRLEGGVGGERGDRRCDVVARPARPEKECASKSPVSVSVSAVRLVSTALATGPARSTGRDCCSAAVDAGVEGVGMARTEFVGQREVELVAAQRHAEHGVVEAVGGAADQPEGCGVGVVRAGQRIAADGRRTAIGGAPCRPAAGKDADDRVC